MIKRYDVVIGFSETYFLVYSAHARCHADNIYTYIGGCLLSQNTSKLLLKMTWR